jgi:hypothetical protein
MLATFLGISTPHHNHRLRLWVIGIMALGCWVFSTSPVRAGVAYGSINNFDCVNDTGVECHGFDVEIEDIHSADITYTYNWNHYGTPQITEDNSNPAHPRVISPLIGHRFFRLGPP